VTTYEILAPDGKKYRIDGPEGASQDQVQAEVMRQNPHLGAPAPSETAPAPEAAAPPKPSSLVDSLRTLPGSVAQGVAGVAGLPGDMQSLVNQGTDYLFDKATGYDGPPVPNKTAMPTSGQFNDAVSKPFGGYYEPQTLAGEYTRTVGQFAPAAVSPGSLMARALRVAVPAVASETGGQLTKGSSWEPYARAGFGLAGGLAQGMREAALKPNLQSSAPSLEDLSKAKTAAYKAAEDSGVVIKKDAWQDFSRGLQAKLGSKPLRADLHKNAVSALDTIASEAGDVTLENADAIRQVINDAIETASAPGANGGDLRRAMQVKEGLDDFLDGLKASDVLNGDPAVAVPLLKEARSLAAREFKGREIQKLIDLAENSASTNYSASGVEQALRVQFKGLNAKLIKDPSLAKTFTQAERDSIAKVAEGGPLGNALRWLGKWAPTGPVSTGLGAGVGGGIGATIGAAGGPVGAAIGAGIGAGTVAGVGGLARSGASAITRNNAELAAALMRAGKPMAATENSTPRNLALQMLLSQAGR